MPNQQIVKTRKRQRRFLSPTGRTTHTIPILLLVLLAGCAAEGSDLYVKKMQERVKPISCEEPVKCINKAYGSLKTIKAEVIINFLGPGLNKSKQCKGKLYYEAAPLALRIDGYKGEVRPFLEAPEKYFTVLVKEGHFWIDLPFEQKLLVGKLELLDKTEKYEIKIRPKDVLKAITVKALPKNADSVFLEKTENDYILSVYEKSLSSSTLARQLWVDRKTLHVRRELYYSPKGYAELEIKKDDYVKKTNMYYPRYIQILRMRTGEMNSFYFKSLHINQELDKSVFDSQMPGNPEVVEIRE